MNIIIRSSSAHFHDTKIATYHLIRQSDELKSSIHFVFFLFLKGLYTLTKKSSSTRTLMTLQSYILTYHKYHRNYIIKRFKDSCIHREQMTNKQNIQPLYS